jgi:hypothetical protein
MLLWVLLIGGLVAILAIVVLVVSVSRAERRARRSLYRALGLADTTVEFLMERNRDVLTELSYVRGQGEAAVSQEIEAALLRHRNVVFLRPGLRPQRAPDGEAGADEDDRPDRGPTSPPPGTTRH